MKKILLCTLFFLPAYFAAAQPKDIRINGAVKNAAGEKLYLETFDKSVPVKLDSILLSKKGAFSFTRKIEQTDFFRLTLASGDFIVLILQPGEKVQVEGDAGESLNKSYQVKGSVHSQKIRELTGVVNRYFTSRDSLQLVLRDFVAQGNQADAQQTNRKLEDLYKNFVQQRDRFLDENPESPAVLGVLNHLNVQADLVQLRKIEKALETSIPGSPYHESVKTLREQSEQRIAEQERQRQEQEARASRLKPGEMAPDIVMNDAKGQPLPLSSLRGQYVLIDFWASWCGPCRRENPNVVRVYEKYKDKGFTIYSVSIDHAEKNWLDAIEKDQLSWPYHVSSLEGWKTPILREYGINGIPFTVLIDKDGRIIQTNLRGGALEQKLAEIFDF